MTRLIGPLSLALVFAFTAAPADAKRLKIPPPPTNAEAHEAIKVAMVETMQVFDSAKLTVEPNCPLVARARICRGSLGSVQLRFKVAITLDENFLVSAQTL